MGSLSFTRALETAAAMVDRRLDRLLTAGEGTDAGSRRLLEAMRYAVLGGGKRFRPFLLMECARLCGARRNTGLDAAAALECVHCYSLVHDDLPAMDDDRMRRGRPTLHVAYDEAAAILAGDALLTLAFEILAGPRAHADPAVRGALALGLARAAGAGGMAGGQALDLMAQDRALDLGEIRRMQRLKTGALIAYACEAGGLVAGAGRRERALLARYGAAVGSAFQLADDLLDAVGDAERVGKATGKDRAAGKATLVARLGIDAARGELAALVDEAEAALAPFGARAATLIWAARFVAARDK